jgi:type I restriction enzyme, S subunit
MSEWETTTVGAIADIFDGPHATPTKTADGPWFLSISSLKRGQLDLNESAHLSGDDFKEWTRRVTPREGDILFSYETRLGEAALMPPGIEACLGRRMGLLRPRSGKSDPRFLLYAYLAPGFQQVIRERAIHGATVDRIPLVDLPAWPIRLPALQEQQAIGKLLGALDDKIAANDRIIGTALNLGDAYFIDMARALAAYRPTLAELAGEKALNFGDGYRTKRSEHGQPGLPILRVAEVMNGRIQPEFADFVADSYRSAMGGKVSQAGDVILTSKGTVGRVAVITEKDPSFVYSPQLCYFRVLAGSPLQSSYIYFWLRSSDFWLQAETRKSQTDMADYLSLTDIRKLTIPMPSPGSDHDWPPTLSYLLARISACDEENRALAELRGALLPKLMSGEIHVRDAEKVVEDVT